MGVAPWDSLCMSNAIWGAPAPTPQTFAIIDFLPLELWKPHLISKIFPFIGGSIGGPEGESHAGSIWISVCESDKHPFDFERSSKDQHWSSRNNATESAISPCPALGISRNYLLQAPINLQLDVANHWNLNGKPSLPIECLQNHWKNNLNNLNHQFLN